MKYLYAFAFALLFCCSSVFAQVHTKDSLQAYTLFLQKQNTTAKDYILNLFTKYDIVILCERDHREITQYNLICDILADTRFSCEVGAIYCEIGNMAYNKAINRFLQDDTLSPDEVEQGILTFHRNIYGASLWEKANYSYLLQSVHSINKNLGNNKIEVFGLERGVNWDTVTQADILRRNVSTDATFRDAVLAENFINYHRYSRTGKALIILNYRHAFMQDIAGRCNAGRYIYDTYGDRVANVYINSFSLAPDGTVQAVQEGLWDAAFAMEQKDNIGFDLVNTPFGNASFDMIPFATTLTYAQVFTGMVYYTHFTQLRIVQGMPNFVDDEFAREMQRRYRLEGNLPPDIETLKQRYNRVIDRTYQEEFPAATKQVELWVNDNDN